MSSILIIGGGISGLFAAYLLKKKFPQKEIILVEKAKSVGGLLRSVNYDRYGYFDYGIHTFYETGVAAVDEFIHDVLPSNQWNYHTEHYRDFGGTYFNGVMQANSAYIDLRNFQKEEWSFLVDSFFKKSKELSKIDYLNAKDYFDSKFSPEITEKVFNPIIEKCFGKKCFEMDSFISKLLPLDRLVMFDEKTMDSLISSEFLRERIAYTNQLTLQRHLLPKKKSIYPNVYGLQRYIQKLTNDLKNLGVRILTEAQIVKIKISENKIDKHIDEVTISHNEQAISFENPYKVYCSTGVLTSAYLLGSSINHLKWERPLKTLVVNFGLKQIPKVQSMFYIYCLENNFVSHRVSCPSSFCPGSVIDGIYKLSVEVIFKEEVLIKEQILSKVISEMVEMKIFNYSDVVFSAVEVVDGGYPVLTTQASANIVQLGIEIQNLNIQNFKNIGLMSRKDLFYQTDILKSVYEDLILKEL